MLTLGVRSIVFTTGDCEAGRLQALAASVQKTNKTIQGRLATLKPEGLVKLLMLTLPILAGLNIPYQVNQHTGNSDKLHLTMRTGFYWQNDQV